MNDTCEACLGLGVIITSVGIVQRCDACGVFPNDESAAHAVSLNSVKLACTACDYWEMSITGRSIPCSECRGILQVTA